MRDYSCQNKAAWEYSAYDFWVMQSGRPEERAQLDRENPRKMLRKYADYFDDFQGVRVANICGSCGKKAVPLALLGADVTVFDISEENCRYALEVARAADVSIRYEVGDVLDIDREKFGGAFDVVFMEGGVLAYFHDLDEFMQLMHALLKKDGRLICSDFHPFNKITDALGLELKTMGYFDADVFDGEMAHARFYPDDIRQQMPKCSYRKYTVSEIINAIIRSGMVLDRFDEHPAWENAKLPGEFTAVAHRP